MHTKIVSLHQSLVPSDLRRLLKTMIEGVVGFLLPTQCLMIGVRRDDISWEYAHAFLANLNNPFETFAEIDAYMDIMCQRVRFEPEQPVEIIFMLVDSSHFQQLVFKQQGDGEEDRRLLQLIATRWKMIASRAKVRHPELIRESVETVL
jgi:hypothetical protein